MNLSILNMHICLSNYLKMEIAVKGVTWTEILLSIEPGASKCVPYRYAPTIRNLISASLSVRYPERKFTTKRVNDNTLRITSEA